MFGKNIIFSLLTKCLPRPDEMASYFGVPCLKEGIICAIVHFESDVDVTFGFYMVLINSLLEPAPAWNKTCLV